MYLMRIGQPGAEKPVVRIDADTYVDVSDIVPDFNEAFFGTSGALAELRVGLVASPVSGSGRRSRAPIRFCASA
jgi:2,4-diketo-3-deoxy-L-fuconate hydrolase